MKISAPNQKDRLITRELLKPDSSDPLADLDALVKILLNKGVVTLGELSPATVVRLNERSLRRSKLT